MDTPVRSRSSLRSLVWDHFDPLQDAVTSPVSSGLLIRSTIPVDLISASFGCLGFPMFSVLILDTVPFLLENLRTSDWGDSGSLGISQEFSRNLATVL